MSDYMPVEAILKILSTLPIKSVVKCRSVCKSWNTLISNPSFILAHLQASLSNNTPILLIGCEKHSRETLSLHHDNDGFDKLKQLPFPPFVVGSCNGLICVQLDYYDYDLDFVLWNPSIQNYISLPQANICEVEHFNVGFGFDSRTNDYKLLILGVDKDGSWIEPYLFSLNENCWKRVNAFSTNYDFLPVPLHFVNGAVHWLGYQKRNSGGHSHVILGFDLSAEVFSVISLPQSLTGFSPFDLSIMKYGESSFVVSIDPLIEEFHELWVMKEYGGVESWTKVLTLYRVDRYASIPRVLGFRKNGKVLLEVDDGKMTSLDLNSQQVGASLDLNCELMEFHGVEVGADILSLNSYVKSLVLLDKAVDVSSESDVNHPIDSSDSDESIGGD
ncbi:hypothetical protein V6N11_079249 [Hibiscus sabdariffa]|uniref:Uncharacterized protein n=2 Tax=Hibiscus sabdariffa TaxID=183260 RepID=A0ABR1Z6X7_9ROSI